MPGTIETRLHDTTLVLTIGNEMKRKALSRDMIDSLRRHPEWAHGDALVATAGIIGSGDKAFCSGHDHIELIECPDAALEPDTNSLFLLPRNIRKPVFAAVNGPAVVGGLNLAISCDIRIASNNANFPTTGPRSGLLSIGGQLSVLPQLIGAGTAMDMLLRSRAVDAARVWDVGLVTELLEDRNALLNSALEIATALAETPPALNEEIKGAAWSTMETPGEEHRRVEVERGETSTILPRRARGCGNSSKERQRMRPRTKDTGMYAERGIKAIAKRRSCA
ncbi:enoyl-CoA hydratase/isomerase family protein [Rhodococcus opacus]|uniref:enoyl-CoA hydratase/isomerase family protein n=1 Tax=Rhodococcus opacus TaxID=37919 RepID=UPI002235DE67|nr:enoyl-CoA hydratase/isomerase family protein [Rhodococcus opacus]UZG60214.1 enoyl-CoA hydratase/isomerase family protein [Rhodococcus opacus]